MNELLKLVGYISRNNPSHKCFLGQKCSINHAWYFIITTTAITTITTTFYTINQLDEFLSFARCLLNVAR